MEIGAEAGATTAPEMKTAEPITTLILFSTRVSAG
jgi:hypothetical protein